MRLVNLFLVFAFVFVYSSLAYAKPKGNFSDFKTDQERCQEEANYMASRNIRGHVFGNIGSFEGIGFGSSPNCKTCVPRTKMKQTGDASAQSANGTWYRVRSWR